MSDEKVTLVTADGKKKEVTMELANMSKTIVAIIEDAGTENDIPLPNVNEVDLERVLSWAEKVKKGEDPVKAAEPFYGLPKQELFNLILASNYLDMKTLLEQACKAVAQLLKGKTPDEICEIFGVKNDFTPEELEEVKKENEWLDEK